MRVLDHLEAWFIAALMAAATVIVFLGFVRPRNSALVTSRRSSGPIIAFWVSSRAHRRAALGRLLAFLIPIASP
jgi:hypothetical protein